MGLSRLAKLEQELRAQTEALEEAKRQLEGQQQENQRLLCENALLKQKIDLLARRIFGVRSEKLDPSQLEFLMMAIKEAPEGNASASSPMEEAPEKSSKDASHRKNRRNEPRWPQNLEVVEQVVDPEPVKAEPQAWRCIGQEVSEQLDYEPARFLVRRLVRRKYVKKADAEKPPVIAPLPESLQERCIAAPGLLAQIVVSKYCDHLPLYRQEMIYAMRHKVYLPRQNMARWMGLVADWLRPIYEQIRVGVMGGGYVQVDETPVRYLEPGNGKTKLGYLWTCNKPDGGVCYHWYTSRAAECLEKIIPVSFDGTIQCDAYKAYTAFARRRGDAITLAGCWAHARRGFFDAKDEAPRHAGWFLRQIQNLYKIEAELRKRRAGPRLRRVVRHWQSRPIYTRIAKALRLFKANGKFLPQSLMGNAISYALDNWELLGRYLEDGHLEIDNNLVENAIRPTCLGKKNWLFFGDAHAGERSAILYTIIENCRREGIDPDAYLRDVLTRLPTMTNWQIKDVTPAAWAKARKAELKKAA